MSLLFSITAHGQDISFQYLGKPQGMNAVASWHCAIDAYGYFWIATSDGLVRFNGKETTYYYSRTHPELPSDQIGFVICDSRNQIWACTERGLVCIDAQRAMHRQVLDPDDPDRDVRFCFEGGDGKIYALSQGSAFSLESLHEDWRAEPWLDSLIAGRRIRDLRKFDQEKFMIVHENSGVLLIDTKSKKEYAYIAVPGAHSVATLDSHHILIGKSGRFGLVHAHITDTSSIRDIILPTGLREQITSPIMYMAQAADGGVYMTTTNDGLVRIDQTLQQVTNYEHDPANPATLASNHLRFVLTDKSGTLVVTSTDGVNYAQVLSPTVTHVNYLTTPEGKILDDRVMGIAEDIHSRLWICLSRDVLILSPDLKTTSRPAIPTTHRWNDTSPAPFTVGRDMYDNMWIAWRSEGIGVFTSDGRMKTFLSSADFPIYARNIDRTRVLYDGQDGYMYIGTEGGFFRIAHDGYQLDTFPEHPELRKLKSARIVDIEIRDSTLWVSSSPGGAAWRYDLRAKTMIRYTTDNGLSSNRVYGIATDNYGNAFIGSHEGFSIIHADSSITILTKDQGLMSPRVESVEVAADGSVWLANNFRLLKYDRETQSTIAFGTREGLSSVDFAIMGSAKLSSGKIAFRVNKGFIIVDPTKLKVETKPLKVFVFYHDPEGREIPCHDGQLLKLQYQQRNARFSFGVNDIIVSRQVLYRYRISSGSTAVWSAPSLNTFVDFSPGPGIYTLEVEAFDGREWYPTSHLIQIQVQYPWWQQWWFIALVSLTVMTLLWLYYKNSINRYRKELSVARQISDLESKALRAQMNPHFVFNCLNAIQECVVTGRIDEAYMYLSKFSRLLRLVLEHSDLSEITLHQELEILDLYVTLEKLRFRDSLDFSLHVGEEVETETTLIPPMLVQPHIENAIWHGLRHRHQDRKLTISIHEQDNAYIQIIIEDNGVGRKKAAEFNATRIGANQRHSSKGLTICSQRIELLQQQYPQASMKIEDLFDEHGVATGTRVTVVLPIVLKAT